MTNRQRIMNTLLGKPVDRLPMVEMIANYDQAVAFSRWDKHIGPNGDPHLLLGFDCSEKPEAGKGYEISPIDWGALPRYETRSLPDAGKYKRQIHPGSGLVMLMLPEEQTGYLGHRVYDSYPVVTRKDWLEHKKRFKLSTEGRFPDNWDEWCEYSETSEYPICFRPNGGFSLVANVIGREGDSGLFVSLYDRPGFVKEIMEHFTELACICAEKTFKEAKIDFIVFSDDPAGSSGPLVGPETMREFFLGVNARIAQLARSYGIQVILMQPRGDIRPLIEAYRQAGVNGISSIEDEANMHLEELLDKYGDSMCFVGGIDGRVLLGSFEQIEREVNYKVNLARRGRVIPCLSRSVYPEVPYPNYAHYAECMRRAIMR